MVARLNKTSQAKDIFPIKEFTKQPTIEDGNWILRGETLVWSYSEFVKIDGIYDYSDAGKVGYSDQIFGYYIRAYLRILKTPIVRGKQNTPIKWDFQANIVKGVGEGHTGSFTVGSGDPDDIIPFEKIKTYETPANKARQALRAAALGRAAQRKQFRYAPRYRTVKESKIKVKILKEDVKKKSTKEKYFGSVVTQLKKNPELAIDSTWIMTSPALGKSLGHGYSRTVYEIPENKNLVIKLAKSSQVKAGSFTNAQEVKHFNKYPEFFPKVYESGETSWERQSVIRADPADWVTKTDVKEFPKALWLIVDKVIPIRTQTEYWKFIHKSFPQLVEAAGMLAKSSGEGRSSLTPTQALIALWEIMMEASWEAGNTSRKTPEEAVTAIAQLILETRYWGLRKVLSFKKRIPPDGDVMGSPDKEWFLKRQDILDEAKKIYNAVGKDTKLARLIKLCDETGIDSNDIRHENVGTDVATKTKFILLDIGIFLNDYLVKAPAVDASKPPPL